MDGLSQELAELMMIAQDAAARVEFLIESTTSDRDQSKLESVRADLEAITIKMDSHRRELGG